MTKVVLITSASSGIGRVTALFLAQQGYIVYAGTRDPAKFPITLDNLHVIALYLTDSQNIKIAINTIYNEQGKIDILVNNTGYALVSTIEDATDEEMFKPFDVNVFGLMKMTRAVIPYMRKAQTGVIINISSFLGKMGLPLLSHYNASKYAVEAFVDFIRFEMAPYNVRVHSIQSGLFGTNFVKKGLITNSATTSKESPYKDLAAHFIPVGSEATTFEPLRKELSDEYFENKVKDAFGL